MIIRWDTYNIYIYILYRYDNTYIYIDIIYSVILQYITAYIVILRDVGSPQGNVDGLLHVWRQFFTA